MSWLSRLTRAFHSKRLDDDLRDEIDDHLDRRAADLIRQGLSDAEARVRARRTFGNVLAIREASRAIKTATAVESLWRDLSYACRGLARRPVFALTAILSISIAAGATTAVYALINATVLRPLPVPQADRLVLLSTTGPAGSAAASAGDRELFSYPLYDELSAAAGDAGRLALLDDPHRSEVQTQGDGGSENIVSQFVSPDTFEILGVSPAAGQLLSRSEDRYPAPRLAVVLSYDYWTRRFAADRAAVGRSILVDGRPHTIVGVTRAGFRGVEPGQFVDIWRPITTFDPGVFTNPAFRSFRLLGRLGPGTTARQLAARLEPTFRNHQETRIHTGATSLPPAEQTLLRATTLDVMDGRTGVSEFRQTFERPLWILLGLTAAILLLACTNVSGLVLARSRARAAEVALRVSLGASPSRVFRQFMIEGGLISVIGVTGGWAIAQVLAGVLVRLVSTGQSPIRLDLTFDMRVLVFIALACGLSSVLIGALPAWRVLSLPPTAAIRRVARQVTSAATGRALVTAQIAFAFCLVTTGSAFLLTLRHLTTVDTGFDSTNVTVLTLANSLGPSQRPLQMELTRELQARIAALPNVQGAATAWWAMFTGARRTQRIALPGRPISGQPELFYRVSPRYLDTLKVPLLGGRDFDLRDNDDEPVPAIINVAFARKYFNSDSPLGQVFTRDDGVRHEVIGIAGDSRYDTLRGASEPIVYMPMKPPNVFTLYVRSPMTPAMVGALVAREASALGFGMRVRDLTTLQALVSGTVVTERLLAGVGAGCALLGLALAVVGLFALLNYTVTERTQEIGVRTALGARRGEIYRLVLGSVAGPVVLGLAVGLMSALAAIHAARALLFGVAAIDPVVLLMALCVFGSAAIVAGAIPARRAAAIDPVVALRND
jgi:predicted permease